MAKMYTVCSHYGSVETDFEGTKAQCERYIKQMSKDRFDGGKWADGCLIFSMEQLEVVRMLKQYNLFVNREEFRALKDAHPECREVLEEV